MSNFGNVTISGTISGNLIMGDDNCITRTKIDEIMGDININEVSQLSRVISLLKEDENSNQMYEMIKQLEEMKEEISKSNKTEGLVKRVHDTLVTGLSKISSTGNCG